MSTRNASPLLPQIPWWVRFIRIQRDATNVGTIKLRNPYPGLGRYLVAKFHMMEAEALAKERREETDGNGE